MLSPCWVFLISSRRPGSRPVLLLVKPPSVEDFPVFPNSS